MALSEGSVGLGMGIWGSSSCPDPSAAPQRLPRAGDGVSRALGEGSKPTAEQPKSSGSFWGCFGVRQRLPRAPLMQNAGTEADLTEIWVGSSGEQPEAPGEGNLCAFPAWTRLRGRPAEIWGAKQSPHPTDPPPGATLGEDGRDGETEARQRWEHPKIWHEVSKASPGRKGWRWWEGERLHPGFGIPETPAGSGITPIRAPSPSPSPSPSIPARPPRSHLVWEFRQQRETGPLLQPWPWPCSSRELFPGSWRSQKLGIMWKGTAGAAGAGAGERPPPAAPGGFGSAGAPGMEAAPGTRGRALELGLSR